MFNNMKLIPDKEIKTRYYIFKCRYPACQEIIPVEFIATRQNSSPWVFRLEKEGRGYIAFTNIYRLLVNEIILHTS
jgi:hypothetical protein